MRMLDLFCGRGGWTNSFLDRGWDVTGIDLVTHPDYRGRFLHMDVLDLMPDFIRRFDFVCASSPCEQFSVHGMKHFHPNPPYPDTGIRLFNHTREICEAAGVPYIMENVRAAQKFVGNAVHHCGPFYLWGNAVPPLMPQGIRKGMRLGTGYSEGCGVPNGTRFRFMTLEQKRLARKTYPTISAASSSEARRKATAHVATIPPEISACVAEYAERILEVVA